MIHSSARMMALMLLMAESVSGMVVAAPNGQLRSRQCGPRSCDPAMAAPVRDSLAKEEVLSREMRALREMHA
jgi:hypothetical protein